MNYGLELLGNINSKKYLKYKHQIKEMNLSFDIGTFALWTQGQPAGHVTKVPASGVTFISDRGKQVSPPFGTSFKGISLLESSDKLIDNSKILKSLKKNYETIFHNYKFNKKLLKRWII